MITYELAKELKDAGFPQVGLDVMNKDLDVFVERNGATCRAWNRIDSEACRVPTLSELIEACSNSCGGFSLKDESSQWDTYGYHSESFYENGQTPEEAVARLWLAIHKISPPQGSG